MRLDHLLSRETRMLDDYRNILLSNQLRVYALFILEVSTSVGLWAHSSDG